MALGVLWAALVVALSLATTPNTLSPRGVAPASSLNGGFVLDAEATRLQLEASAAARRASRPVGGLLNGEPGAAASTALEAARRPDDSTRRLDAPAPTAAPTTTAWASRWRLAEWEGFLHFAASARPAFLDARRVEAERARRPILSEIGRGEPAPGGRRE